MVQFLLCEYIISYTFTDFNKNNSVLNFKKTLYINDTNLSLKIIKDRLLSLILKYKNIQVENERFNQMLDCITIKSVNRVKFHI